MANYLDLLGVNLLWNKVKSKINSIVDSKLADYIDQFTTIKQEALIAKNDAKYYYELTLEAIQSLDPDVEEVLSYAQKVVKHGRAIIEIANQLNATYAENSMAAADDYTPGFILKSVSEETMNDLLANNATKENEIYFVKE